MRIRFGPFEADTAQVRLSKHGIVIPLREQVFQVLSALLERPGEIVTRDDFRRRVWNKSITVDFDAGLNTAISRLREVLNDNPDAPRFIETIPKRGYRFVAAVPKQLGIAVIPFAVQGTEPDVEAELFADGLAEDLITAAARIEGVRIAGRSVVGRLKGNQYDPRELARELNVDVILEGALRRVGEGVRVNLHLLSGVDGFDLWTERFEGDWSQILSFEERIVERVAAALQRRLAAGSPNTRSVDPAAYMAYRRGHHLVARNGPHPALEYFRESSRLDPQYALPHHGAAVAHILLALMGAPAQDEMQAAEQSLDRALALAPADSHVQHTLGMLRMFQCRWTEADHAYERALALDPSNAYAHMMYALEHSFRGRHALALDHARRALDLEPVDVMTNFRMAQCLYYAGQYTETIEWGLRTAELAPSSASAYGYLAWAYIELGRNDEAWTMALKGREYGEGSTLFDGLLGYIAGRVGRRSYAELVLDDVKHQGAAIPTAWAQLGVGDHDLAIGALETAFANIEPYAAAIPVSRIYDPLRSHPRFRALVDLVGRS